MFNTLGEAYKAKEDWNGAIAQFNESIRLDPKQAPVFAARGFAYASKGELDRAIADYSDSLRLDPKQALVFVARGLAYKKKGELDRAIADGNEAIRLDPRSADALRLRVDLQLDDQWLRYLKGIQDDGDYANWSGPPLDVFRSSK